MNHRDPRPNDRLNSLPQEPSTAELIEARERRDAGLRPIFPHLFEPGAERGPSCERHVLDHETATVVGKELLSARQAIWNAAKALPLKPQIDLHLAFNGMLNEIDRITGELAERWGSE